MARGPVADSTPRAEAGPTRMRRTKTSLRWRWSESSSGGWRTPRGTAGWEVAAAGPSGARAERCEDATTNASRADRYDAIYFDSDDDEESNMGGRKVQTDEDLFYDPDEDDKNQEWADNARRDHYVPKNKLR